MCVPLLQRVRHKAARQMQQHWQRVKHFRIGRTVLQVGGGCVGGVVSTEYLTIWGLGVQLKAMKSYRKVFDANEQQYYCTCGTWLAGRSSGGSRQWMCNNTDFMEKTGQSTWVKPVALGDADVEAQVRGYAYHLP